MQPVQNHTTTSDQTGHTVAQLGWLLLLIVVATLASSASVEAQSSTVSSFESNCGWRRGNQPWGTLALSTEQVHDGVLAGKLDYDFPASEAENFVVFQCATKIPGTPNKLSMWVYGDNSGNLLNVWLTDADNKKWQFAFGPIRHSGWQQMYAVLDPSLPWPTGPIDGSGATTLKYPIRFNALVVDNPSDVAAKGTIYLDTLAATESEGESGSVTANPSNPQPPARLETIQPPEAEIVFYVDSETIDLGQCTVLHWHVQHVRAYYINDKGAGGDDGQKEICPEQTTDYVLKVIQRDNREEYRKVSVQVRRPDAVFYADDSVVYAGDCTYLNWRVTGVDAVFLDGEDVPLSDSRWVCPSSDTTYDLIAKTPYNESSYTTFVKVRPRPALCVSTVPDYMIYVSSPEEKLTFPDTVYRGRSSRDFFLLSSCGAGPLEIRELAIYDKDNEFLLWDGTMQHSFDGSRLIQPGEECYVQLSFAPTFNYDQHLAKLVVVSDDAITADREILLTGNSRSLETVEKQANDSDSVGAARAWLKSAPPYTNCVQLLQGQ